MTDINIGAISEALNNKVDLPSPSTPQDAVDYVVEKQDPTSANGYTWYRKYKSGWVEQGLLRTGSGTVTLTLPIAMANTNYSVQVSAQGNSSDLNDVRSGKWYNRTTTTVQVNVSTGAENAATEPALVEIRGYAA